jgi:hypothetical protein
MVHTIFTCELLETHFRLLFYLVSALPASHRICRLWFINHLVLLGLISITSFYNASFLVFFHLPVRFITQDLAQIVQASEHGQHNM